MRNPTPMTIDESIEWLRARQPRSEYKAAERMIVTWRNNAQEHTTMVGPWLALRPFKYTPLGYIYKVCSTHVNAHTAAAAAYSRRNDAMYLARQAGEDKAIISDGRVVRLLGGAK